MDEGRGRQRRFRITIRVSFNERNVIEEAASRTGVTVSAYARRVLLGTKPGRKARRPSIEAALLVNALDRLGCVASNLTRIAYTLQIGSAALLPGTERDLARSLAELRGLRPALLRALGLRPASHDH
jgi:hypothetical protein